MAPDLTPSPQATTGGANAHTPAAVPRLLVLGGSGFVGRHLCHALAGSAVRVTVPTRLDRARWPAVGSHVHFEQTDITQPGRLAALVRGRDVVINLVAILHGDQDAFRRVHVQLVQTLAQACAEARVPHLIHVSALGADPQGPSMYQRSKGEGEQALLLAQAQSGLNVSIVRPSVIFGQDDQFLNTFARLQRFAPLVPLTGAHTRFQPVWVDDVARALAILAQSQPQPGRILEACGPEIFTLADLVRHAGRWSGHRRPVLPLPQALGKLQAWCMEQLPGTPLMSRDNVDSLRVDNVATGTVPGLASLGLTPASLASVFPIS